MIRADVIRSDVRRALKHACFEAEKFAKQTDDRRDWRRVKRLRKMIDDLK